MKTRIYLIFSFLLAMLAGVNAPALADDTDIYLTPQSSAGGEPLIMLSLDYRSNLNSTVCQGYSQPDGVPDAGSNCGSIFSEASSAGSDDSFLPADVGSVKFFELFRAVLKVVMDPLDGVKVGLMINHSANNNCAGPQEVGGNAQGCSNGGYMLLGFESMQAGDSNGKKADFHAKLASIPLPQGNLSHTYQGAELFFELFRYLTGQGIYNGHNGYTDFDSTNDRKNLNEAQTPDRRDIAWDTGIEQNGQYISPLDGNCAKIFTINFMFAVSNQENDSNTAISADKSAGGLGINVSNNSAFKDVIGGLYNADLGDASFPNIGELEGEQNVTSYFFIDPSQIQQANQKGYALAGGTVSAIPLDGNQADNIKKDLEDVFNQILSISTTFVSATVPVNTFNRSESLDNVYFGMFEPEIERQWAGNVKRLKLHVTDEGTLMVLDAQQDVNNNPQDAISSVDQRIKDTALTFWTDASGVDVASELGSDTSRPFNGADAGKDEIVGVDGKSVNRGGSGQKSPGFIGDDPTLANTSERKIYTEPASFTNGTATSMLDFDSDEATAEELWLDIREGIQTTTSTLTSWHHVGNIDSDNDGVSDAVEAQQLIGFAGGVDVYDNDADNDTTDARPWMFGDVLHSQPVPVNYGTLGGYTTDNPNLNILVASNDGYIRSIRNNTPGNPGTADGSLNWAFIPRELISNLGDLARNDAGEHPYGADGNITVYTDDINRDGTLSGSDRAIAFFGLRRGGKFIYALDISDPSIPKLLWRINKSGDFAELGQTWSRLTVGKLVWQDSDNDGDVDTDDARPVVIFGGGYDTDKDNRNSVSDDDEGNAIFIVDALTGDLVWKATQCATENCTGNVSATEYSHEDMRDSIPSDVTPFDSNGDGAIDRIYVGDTGGVVWRVDLPGFDRDNNSTPWTITPVLSVGRHANDANGDPEPDRRFFHRPDVVPTTDDAGNFDGIMIGSGNRPHPQQNAFNDRFFMLKDRNTTTGTPPASVKTATQLEDITASSSALLSSQCETSGEESAACASLDNLQQNGWFINLVIGQNRTPPINGEKMLSTSLTYKGVIFFTTYLPNSGSTVSCGPAEGEAYTYVVDMKDGSSYFPTFTENDNRATKSGRGIAGDPIPIVLDGKIFITPGNLPPDPVFRKDFDTQRLHRTFWYEQDE